MNSVFQVIREPDFAHTPWFGGIIGGIAAEARRRGSSIETTDCTADALGKLRFPDADGAAVKPVIFIGSSIPWIEAIGACYFADAAVRPILAGNRPAAAAVPMSTVTINRAHAMNQLVAGLYRQGARRFALVGSEPDSMMDSLRRGLFDAYMERFGLTESAAVYNNDCGMAACLERFTRDARNFDAVFFTNDIPALLFAPRAAAMGIDIPRGLVPIGFGDLSVTAAAMPQLTTFILDFEKVGRTALTTALELLKKPDVLTLHTELACTVRSGSAVSIPPIFLDDAAMAYDEREYAALCYIDRLHAAGDRLNLAILRAVSENLTYGEMSEQLFLSESSLRYRLKNIFAGLRTSSKEETRLLIGKYLPMGMFD